MSEPSSPRPEPPWEQVLPVDLVVASGIVLAALLVTLDQLGWPRFDGNGPAAIPVLLATALLGLMVDGSVRGRLVARGGRIDRRTHPRAFRVAFFGYALAVACLSAVTAGALLFA